jgi:hypothetical protein
MMPMLAVARFDITWLTKRAETKIEIVWWNKTWNGKVKVEI